MSFLNALSSGITATGNAEAAGQQGQMEANQIKQQGLMNTLALMKQQHEMQIEDALKGAQTGAAASTAALNAGKLNGQGFRPPTRNIDPLSPEGLEAEKQRALAIPKPPHNIDPLSPEGLSAKATEDETRAKIAAKYGMVVVTGPDGTPTFMSKAQAAATGAQPNQMSVADRVAKQQAATDLNQSQSAYQGVLTKRPFLFPMLRGWTADSTQAADRVKGAHAASAAAGNAVPAIPGLGLKPVTTPKMSNGVTLDDVPPIPGVHP